MTKHKVYTLFTWGPKETIYSKGTDYRSGMWTAQVKATNIRHAYWLLSHLIPSVNGDPPYGIISLSASEPKTWNWPFLKSALTNESRL